MASQCSSARYGRLYSQLWLSLAGTPAAPPSATKCSCGLTPRSSGAPTAGRQAREAPWYILHFAGLASHRRRPLTSNVRRQSPRTAGAPERRIGSADLVLSAIFRACSGRSSDLTAHHDLAPGPLSSRACTASQAGSSLLSCGRGCRHAVPAEPGNWRMLCLQFFIISSIDEDEDQVSIACLTTDDHDRTFFVWWFLGNNTDDLAVRRNPDTPTNTREAM